MAAENPTPVVITVPLNLFKQSIGDMTSNESDAYYTRLLNMAINDLSTDDVSNTVLNTDYGQDAIVVYAMCLYTDKESVATSKTLELFRNKLAIRTKGERYAPEE